MKPPKKIYLHGYDFDDEPCKTWEAEPKVKGLRGYKVEYAEYIRKDALLEWAKERHQQTVSNVGCYTGHSVWEEVIEHIEAL